ncbi:hypothetical protein SAICODRAFT_16889 [Saitoella complicata NRRL Y-17804]|uniref:TRP C-terminal domain-containing protein n=1 Tax=Saitoella complicata (strain BCRC 22490 / CBS 7301 / JCM 7358 / NBRC 10748 / NRRL Y-17804) TaxID=698492 RepID=A0A0E9NAD3_SAICN|nr:uncharacterized protein SAICODRAFT_16889 [Saitoella complicata NRRL Y-17804]ODQ55853.1 hypothetical protein SAICODRAFT_16889 [Saitoella complicata NRRL Y-17804]GAO46763.1 hypothetical protein G7K_0985-t1 [Saitoella complicata NRRL Y-17804]
MPFLPSCLDLHTPLPSDQALPRTMDAEKGYRKAMGRFYVPAERWSVVLILTCLIEAIVVIGLESYLLKNLTIPDAYASSTMLSTYVGLFIFADIFKLFMAWDALRLKNVLQAVGLVFCSVALTVYAVLQWKQLAWPIANNAWEQSADIGAARTVFDTSYRISVSVVVIISTGTLLIAISTYKIFHDSELAWRLARELGASPRIRRVYQLTQIYSTLLKINLFFVAGFLIQLAIIVPLAHHPEKIMTWIAIPVTVVTVVLGICAVRWEVVFIMLAVEVLQLGALGYFCYKLWRIWAPESAGNDDHKIYDGVKKSLTVFAVTGCILLLITFGMGIVCMRNFREGLLQAMDRAREIRRLSRASSGSQRLSTFGPGRTYSLAPIEEEGRHLAPSPVDSTYSNRIPVVIE